MNPSALISAGLSLVGSMAERKINNVPTPPDPTGTQRGQDYVQFMDQAFPGTTPWERLGANTPYGSTVAADTSANASLKLKDKEIKSNTLLRTSEMDNARSIAESNNLASVIASSVSGGPDAMREAVKVFKTQGAMSASPYDTMVGYHHKKLPYETQNMASQTQGNQARNVVDLVRAKNARGVVGSEITQRLGSAYGKTMSNALMLKNNIYNSMRENKQKFVQAYKRNYSKLNSSVSNYKSARNRMFN